MDLDGVTVGFIKTSKKYKNDVIKSNVEKNGSSIDPVFVHLILKHFTLAVEIFEENGAPNHFGKDSSSGSDWLSNRNKF